MECPACKSALTELKQSDLTVDICDNGCGGLWFDNYELDKVDESHESKGEPLLDMSPHNPVNTSHALQRSCPRCVNMPMMRHYFSIRKEIEIDECPNCGGVWLDNGELYAIREQSKKDEKTKETTRKNFLDLFATQILSQKSAKSAEELKSRKKFARIFRFVCPSYWLPGKQNWGAF